MKFDPPPGSVFGGYGFWSYSDAPDTRHARGSAHDEQSGYLAGLRALAHAASRLLGLTRS